MERILGEGYWSRYCTVVHCTKVQVDISDENLMHSLDNFSGQLSAEGLSHINAFHRKHVRFAHPVR